MIVVVIGIGQSLRGDDAAGLDAVRRWREKYPGTANRSGVRVEMSELPGLSLLDLLEGADAAVIVDTVHSGAPPGTLLRLNPDDLSAFTTEAQSAHGWGVAESLHLGGTLSPSLASCRVTLIGLAASQVKMGASLSPEVEAALEGAVDMIEREVESQL